MRSLLVLSFPLADTHSDRLTPTGLTNSEDSLSEEAIIRPPLAEIERKQTQILQVNDMNVRKAFASFSSLVDDLPLRFSSGKSEQVCADVKREILFLLLAAKRPKREMHTLSVVPEVVETFINTAFSAEARCHHRIYQNHLLRKRLAAFMRRSRKKTPPSVEEKAFVGMYESLIGKQFVSFALVELLELYPLFRCSAAESGKVYEAAEKAGLDLKEEERRLNLAIDTMEVDLIMRMGKPKGKAVKKDREGSAPAKVLNLLEENKRMDKRGERKA